MSKHAARDFQADTMPRHIVMQRERHLVDLMKAAKLYVISFATDGQVHPQGRELANQLLAQIKIAIGE